MTVLFKTSKYGRGLDESYLRKKGGETKDSESKSRQIRAWGKTGRVRIGTEQRVYLGRK